MTTAFDTLIDTMAALLAAAPAVSAAVEKDEVDTIPDDLDSAVEVTLADTVPTQLGGIHGNPVDWQTMLRVVCHARATGTGATARTACNALVAAVHAKVMADTTLGLGPDWHVEAPRLNWDAARKASRMAACEMLYLVRHRTGATLLT